MGVSYCFVIECHVDFAWENFELLRKTRLKEQGTRLIFGKKPFSNVYCYKTRESTVYPLILFFLSSIPYGFVMFI
jgi:hypothetical protein